MKTSINTLYPILVACAALALGGCNHVDPAQYQSVKLPPPMQYQQDTKVTKVSTTYTGEPVPSSSLGRSASARPGETLTRGRLLSELRGIGIRTRFNVADNTYVIPDHDWVQRQFDPYFRVYLHYLAATYRAEGMDCDNFSNMYQQNLVLANLKAGGQYTGDVPCAVLVVNQRDQGIIHALNLVRTNRGWYIVEPQDGQFTPLTSYRYKHDIAYVDF